MNTREMKQEIEEKDANRDPISGEPGSHPVGTGLGAAGGAAAGAAIGAAGGPVGMAVGGVIGAVAGGFAGHAIAEEIDPTAEDAYWRENHKNEPYYDKNYNYSDYGPAYRSGYNSVAQGRGDTFEDAEPELSREWNENRGDSRLEWDHAKHAAKAGWTRVKRPQSENYKDITEH